MKAIESDAAPDWRTDEYWTQAQVRTFLKLDGKSKDRTWTRVKPLLATARLNLPAAKLYHAGTVRRLLEGRFAAGSPLRRHSSLRKVS